MKKEDFENSLLPFKTATIETAIRGKIFCLLLH